MTVSKFYEELKQALVEKGFVVMSHRNKKGDYLVRLDYGQLRDIRIGTKRTYNSVLKYNISKETIYESKDSYGCRHFPLDSNQINNIVGILLKDRDNKYYEIGRKKVNSMRGVDLGYSMEDKESIILIAKGRQVYNNILNYKISCGDKIKNFK